MAAAPEVFEVRDDDFLYVLQEEPSEELREKVEAAARSCPKTAITIEDRIEDGSALTIETPCVSIVLRPGGRTCGSQTQHAMIGHDQGATALAPHHNANARMIRLFRLTRLGTDYPFAFLDSVDAIHRSHPDLFHGAARPVDFNGVHGLVIA